MNCPTLDEGRVSFTCGIKERKREKYVLGAQHVSVDRYAGNIAEIN